MGRTGKRRRDGAGRKFTGCPPWKTSPSARLSGGESQWKSGLCFLRCRSVLPLGESVDKYIIYLYVFKEHPPPACHAQEWPQLTGESWGMWRGHPRSLQGIRGPGKEEGAVQKLADVWVWGKDGSRHSPVSSSGGTHGALEKPLPSLGLSFLISMVGILVIRI